MAEEPSPPKVPLTKLDEFEKRKIGRGWLVLLMAFCVFSGPIIFGYFYAWPLLQNHIYRQTELEQQFFALEKASLKPNATQQMLSEREFQTFESLKNAQESWQKTIESIRTEQNLARADNNRLSNRLTKIEGRLERITKKNRDVLLGHEAGFLVRLAREYLFVTRNIDDALVLLERADYLLILSDQPLYDVARGGLANDISRLDILIKSDLSRIHSELASLLETVVQLRMSFRARIDESLIEQPKNQGQVDVDAATGWRAALQKISNHFSITKANNLDILPMSGEQEEVARQTLFMVLEQSQMAVLSSNQALYEKSLSRAKTYLELFTNQDASAVKNLLAEIDQLMKENVAPDLPQLIETSTAIEFAIKRLEVEASE